MRGRALLTLVNREWMTSWRGGSGYFQRSAYAALLLAFGSMVALSLAMSGDYGFPEDIVEFARGFFSLFCILQFVVLTVLASAVFTRSLFREKERETLDLIVISPVGRFEILFGKVLGDFAGILAVILAGAPIICFLVVLGGVSFGEIVSVHLILLGHLLLVGGICMILSVLLASISRVMMLAWVVLAAGLFAGDLFWAPLHALSPLSSLLQELRDPGVSLGGSAMILLEGAALLVLLCMVGGSRLDRQNERQVTGGSRTGFFGHIGELLRALADLSMFDYIFRPPRKGHLVQRRECDLSRDREYKLLWLGFAVVYILAACWAELALERFEVADGRLLLIILGLYFILLCVVLHITVRMNRSRRSGEHEILLASNVEPAVIVSAKIRATMKRAFYLLLFPMAHTLLVVGHGFKDDIGALKVLWIFGTWILCLWTLVMLCMFFASRSRSLVASLSWCILVATPLASIPAFLTMATLMGLVLVSIVVVPGVLGVYVRIVRGFRRRAVA